MCLAKLCRVAARDDRRAGAPGGSRHPAGLREVNAPSPLHREARGPSEAQQRRADTLALDPSASSAGSVLLHPDVLESGAHRRSRQLPEGRPVGRRSGEPDAFACVDDDLRSCAELLRVLPNVGHHLCAAVVGAGSNQVVNVIPGHDLRAASEHPGAPAKHEERKPVSGHGTAGREPTHRLDERAAQPVSPDHTRAAISSDHGPPNGRGNARPLRELGEEGEGHVVVALGPVDRQAGNRAATSVRAGQVDGQQAGAVVRGRAAPNILDALVTEPSSHQHRAGSGPQAVQARKQDDRAPVRGLPRAGLREKAHEVAGRGSWPPSGALDPAEEGGQSDIGPPWKAAQLRIAKPIHPGSLFGGGAASHPLQVLRQQRWNGRHGLEGIQRGPPLAQSVGRHVPTPEAVPEVRHAAKVGGGADRREVSCLRGRGSILGRAQPRIDLPAARDIGLVAPLVPAGTPLGAVLQREAVHLALTGSKQRMDGTELRPGRDGAQRGGPPGLVLADRGRDEQELLHAGPGRR